MFDEYLEPAFRARTEGWALNADRNRRFVVDGWEHPPFPKEISVRKRCRRKAGSRCSTRSASARGAVSLRRLVAGYMEPDFSHAAMRAYNAWMADWCGAFPERLKFAAPVALHDIGEAVREARRAVGDLGAVRLPSVPTRSPGSGSTTRTGSRSGPRSRSSACR